MEVKLFIHYVMEHCDESGIWKKDHSEYPSKIGVQPIQLKGMLEQLGEELILDTGNHLLLPFFLERSYGKTIVDNPKTRGLISKIEKVAPEWWEKQLKSKRYSCVRETVDMRKDAFKAKVIQTLKEYKQAHKSGKVKTCPTSEQATKFLEYWSRIGDDGRIMKFEMKKYQPWNTRGRMATWIRNDY
jgi:hypothetical protein